MSLTTSLRDFAYPKREEVDSRFYEHPIARGYEELSRYLDNSFYHYRIYEQLWAEKQMPFTVRVAKYAHMAEVWAIRAEIMLCVAKNFLDIQSANHFEEAAKMYARNEQGILDVFRKYGCDVEIDDSEVSLKEIEKNRTLVYANHQRSGIETLLLRGIIKRPIHVVMKDEMKRSPLIGEMQDKSGAIYVPRQELDFRKLDVGPLTQQIADGLIADGGVLIFPEGTKSESGEICGNWKKGRGRRQWAKTIDDGIDDALGSSRNAILKVLAILDVHNLFDKNLDQEPFKSTIRKKAGIRVKLVPMEGKSMNENWQNYTDENTVFGTMRKTLLGFQETLRKELGR